MKFDYYLHALYRVHFVLPTNGFPYLAQASCTSQALGRQTP